MVTLHLNDFLIIKSRQSTYICNGTEKLIYLINMHRKYLFAWLSDVNKLMRLNVLSGLVYTPHTHTKNNIRFKSSIILHLIVIYTLLK